MRRSLLRLAVCLACVGVVVLPQTPRLSAAEVTAKQVLDSIDKAKRFLLKAQQADGAWRLGGGGDQFAVGVTSLAMLALLNTGMTAADPEIQHGLGWLRRQDPNMTYEISLMIQALAAAKEGKKDHAKVLSLVRDLEDMQLRAGPNAGSWGYTKAMNIGGGDRSNGQFAVLGLREAQEMGVPVNHETWRRARAHWLASQNGDGGWGYSGPANPRGGSTGSMTVAGIATLVITHAMLRAEEKELNGDGTPVCCAEAKMDKPLEDALRWMGNSFAVTHNPGSGQWLLYYLYGLERAGRFSGRRFFVGRTGRHDWYREGSDYLVNQQNAFLGTWAGQAGPENDPVVGTSFALMFLSKGLAPVLINKLQYGPREGNRPSVADFHWNRHPDDVRNLTQLISNRPKWPKLLTWQTVDVAQADVADMMQAPILFIAGSDPLQFSEDEIRRFKEYILQGGFLFFDNNCQSAEFDESFKDLVRQMYPSSEAQLKRLTADHPVFRSEFNLIDDKTGQPLAELWGVDVGCRTSIMYSPHDLSCLWDKWTSFEIPGRPKELDGMIRKATQVGVNVVAYVTGRELLNKKEREEQVVAANAALDRVERDLLQISKIRYTGDWDAAPQALKNLLVALNRTAGMAASTKPRDLTLVDKNLFRYPIVYLHGRHDFALSRNEQDKLRDYLKQGGVLFSDACCGMPQFDRSFRRLMEQLFPENPLKRIPPDHEMFTSKIGGFDLKTVKRREPDVDNPNAAFAVTVRNVEPFLEGIEINGRYVVIYSKYDISCALERQSSVACTGYLHEDAVKLGVNVILYFLNQ